MVATQLCNELGFHQMRASSLKPKHVEALLTHWRNQRLSVGTLKSRMAQLRWWSIAECDCPIQRLLQYRKQRIPLGLVKSLRCQ